MFRLLAPRRALFASSAAALAIHGSGEKLPIYPTPDPEILLVETPSELERQIGVGRRALTSTYLDAHSRVQGVISRWIGVEQAVETRVKSLIAPEEPLTPGILYVGVAALTGSVLARNRILATRLLLPPTLLILSLNHFLPKTTHNISQYLGSLEDAYFPTLSQKHAVANAHTAMTWERLKDATTDGRDRAMEGVTGIVGRLESTTGLKLKETLGWGKKTVAIAEAKAKEAVEVVEVKAEAVKEVVGKKTGEVKDIAEKKVEEVKRLV
ncbi:MICOS subunit MIC26 [Grifola frondosa]|uniref:MICOS complex subunit n=1 Tax=Grifola frondosa TaxID=5627 RepID=A0A1C7M014_GRIFR|nr:MICOS subunit MIC26 [Grifola frondosa]